MLTLDIDGLLFLSTQQIFVFVYILVQSPGECLAFLKGRGKCFLFFTISLVTNSLHDDYLDLDETGRFKEIYEELMIWNLLTSPFGITFLALQSNLVSS